MTYRQIARSSLPSSERRLRSRLAQCVSGRRFLRGTLSVRTRQCGKPSCRCARGHLHGSLYVVQSRDGTMRQVCVPKEWEERVRQAVGDYQQIQAMIEELSELEWKQLQEGKRNKQKGAKPSSKG